MNLTKVAFALLIAAEPVCSQGLSSSALSEFEVVSIKPANTLDGRTLLQVLPRGSLRARNATATFLISLAYDVKQFQISGGDAWVNSDRFEVLANSDESTSDGSISGDGSQANEEQRRVMQEQMRPKLQRLLAERFNLRLRSEFKENPAYALVVSRNARKIAQSTEGYGFRGLRIGRNQLVGSFATIEMLRTALANQLGRPVIDRTGLSGLFDFRLEWGLDPMPAGASASFNVQGNPGADTSNSDAGGPSIFTALEDQLGLRLESTKAPVEFLVIDHIERPSAN